MVEMEEREEKQEQYLAIVRLRERERGLKVKPLSQGDRLIGHDGYDGYDGHDSNNNNHNHNHNNIIIVINRNSSGR